MTTTEKAIVTAALLSVVFLVVKVHLIYGHLFRSILP